MVFLKIRHHDVPPNHRKMCVCVCIGQNVKSVLRSVRRTPCTGRACKTSALAAVDRTVRARADFGYDKKISRGESTTVCTIIDKLLSSRDNGLVQVISHQHSTLDVLLRDDLQYFFACLCVLGGGGKGKRSAENYMTSVRAY